MIEQTELVEDGGALAIDIRRGVASGQFISYAGSDIARGETLLRRNTLVGSREIGMLAACGLASMEVVRRPRVAVLSTGDELVEPGHRSNPRASTTATPPSSPLRSLKRAVSRCFFGAFPDDETALELAMRSALDSCDMVVLSGGTSKARAICRTASSRG